MGCVPAFRWRIETALSISSSPVRSLLYVYRSIALLPLLPLHHPLRSCTHPPSCSVCVCVSTFYSLPYVQVHAVIQDSQRKSSPPPISSRRLTLNWRRSIPFHTYRDMKNEQVNCLSKALLTHPSCHNMGDEDGPLCRGGMKAMDGDESLSCSRKCPTSTGKLAISYVHTTPTCY
uniref:(California timema) hypothetical protein n=1 Tax=Timema californicum TaxID=61474 RepID=A0A7R9IVV7_TIMCA|nr:unnamed protein product [Timema californicum]